MRSVEEWIGKTDDERIPPRVMLRVLDRYNSRCALCGGEMTPARRWQCDHIKALINGGEHRESNLQPLHVTCHKKKTRGDLALKRKIARVRRKHLGLQMSRHPLPGGRDSPWKRTMGGKTVRR